ncbi:MAG: sialate O-acetylesterase [Bacteroidales bacterium]|nr:sialate O-acetylesterase [Bacteroidales bacterium]
MKTRIILITTIILTLLTALPLHGQVRLPRLISDGMVLQRDTELKIWGWASPGEKVTLEFIGQKYEVTADESGIWKVTLAPASAGGPHDMLIRASNSTTLSDILVGDVWLCSGQSNMELPMRRVRPLYEAEIAAAENNYIRSFTVPKVFVFKEPQSDLSGGRWTAANPETALDFSAAAWFFGKEIYDKYNVPVGLLTSAFGGSPAEAWISEESLKKFPVHYNELQKYKSDSLMAAIATADHKRTQDWYNQLMRADEAYKTFGVKWHDPAMSTDDWKTTTIPGHWSATELKGLNGVVWFRKEIIVPASAAGQPGSINLGRIVDADSAFLNGTFIGTVSYQYPPRRYTIPAGLLKEGSNILTVRVISNIGDGGFVPEKPYDLSAGDFQTSLEGEWKYQVGAVMPPLRGQTFFGYKPAGLYNAMLAPLLNYSIKGILWYQGESNAGRPDEYRSLLPALIKDWRESFGQGDLPFLLVQLPNFMEAKEDPSESGWAMFREAQTEALKLPATGMAVTIDIGEWNDIHPLNKKDVGTRLALVAMKVAYGEDDLVSSGPVYKGMTIKRRRIILSFDNTGYGLMVKGDGKLQQFAIAGADMDFIWAKAKIRGDKVIVKGRKIRHPVAVRYAWADNPEGANLFNLEGLPAAPFRTDNRE